MTQYGPFWEIIDNIWNNQLHRPIHVAGHFLNTRYHYRVQIGDDLIGEIKDGLYDFLECMVLDGSEQMEIHRHRDIF